MEMVICCQRPMWSTLRHLCPTGTSGFKSARLGYKRVDSNKKEKSRIKYTCSEGSWLWGKGRRRGRKPQKPLEHACADTSYHKTKFVFNGKTSSQYKEGV